MISRRGMLGGVGGAVLYGSLLPMGAAFARAPTDKRLVVVILRGGLDALHAVPPYADRDYRKARPHLAVPPPGAEGAIDLDGYFGLHPALEPLYAMYRDRRLAIIPAATTGYRERSHFDGQDVLENGSDTPFGARDGWLNRALAEMAAPTGARLGLAVGHTIPLVLRGATEVQTWAPSRLPKAGDQTLEWLSFVYEGDPLFKAAFAQARASSAPSMAMDRRTRGGPRQYFATSGKAAGQLLASRDGPRVAVLEVGGWDTHAGQVNRLNNLLTNLASGIAALAETLGGAWDETVIAVVSEFGRTVAENGSRGTDHGVGDLALVLGGAVDGGRIAGTWPGLTRRALLDGRDVMPANDYRGIFKGLLHDHLGVSEAALEDRIFPNSRGARAMEGLVRRA